MASLGDILSGALGGEYNMGRPLDEEERRLIEELRAQGMYVPQERKVSPFRYGAGTVSQRNLADVRGAIQPEQERKTKELMWQRGRGARDATAKELRQQQRKSAASQQRSAIKRASSPRAVAERKRVALEEFNRKQAFADQLKLKRIADEQRRQHLSGLPTTPREQRYLKSTAFGESPMISREDFIAGARPQITDPQKAELSVLQREVTPALLQSEALTQAGQKTATGAIDVATKRRADDLAKQVHNLLPPDYAKMIVDKQIVGLELENLLNTHRLAVKRAVGEDLLSTEADAHLAAKRQEIMAIESLESWLVNTREGQEFLRTGGPQRFDMRLKLGQLKGYLMQSEARKAAAGSRNPLLNDPFFNQPGGSGLTPARVDWPLPFPPTSGVRTNAPPSNLLP